MRWISAVLVLWMPLQAPAAEFEGLAAGILAMYANKTTPIVPPPPPVTDICDNCNGTGKLGDGTVFVKCPVCDGTGKKKVTTSSSPQVVPNGSSARPVTPPPRIKYPLRGSWYSGCSNWRHMTTGPHARKFDSYWLSTLPNSELQSLHSDDHEGRVKWQYVVRYKLPVVKSVTSMTKQGGRWVKMCDGRSCRVVWVANK